MPDLPRLLVLATGGTIAGAADPRAAGAYNAGALPPERLLDAIPEAHAIANVRVETLAAIGSQDMSESVWRALAARIAAAEADPRLDGVLVIHGTDTLEETAFFLDLCSSGDKPVVLVGAMRPSHARSADGPANLIAALRVAAHPASRGRGVLVVLHDQVHGARDVTKASTTALDTFRSPNRGALGHVTPGAVTFFAPPAARGTPFGVPEVALPRVAILYAYAGMEAGLVEAVAAGGVSGIVLAGVGDGNGPTEVIRALAQAARGGLACVRASRCPEGPVLRNIEVNDDALGLVASAYLSPAKARILLQLALAAGLRTPAALQAAFDRMA